LTAGVLGAGLILDSFRQLTIGGDVGLAVVCGLLAWFVIALFKRRRRRSALKQLGRRHPF
jgi:hypothetical protein